MAEIQITEMEFDIKELQVVPKAHARAHAVYLFIESLLFFAVFFFFSFVVVVVVGVVAVC